MCWRRIATMLRSDDDTESVVTTLALNKSSEEGFDIARLPRMSYFLVELLTHFVTEEELPSGSHNDRALWNKVNTLSLEQREQIRKEGERAIGLVDGEASRLAGRRTRQSIQHAIFHSRRTDYIG